MSLIHYEDEALGFDDLQKIMQNAIGRKTKIVKLNSVKDNQSIGDIFGPHKEIIIYIPVESAYNGHYVCSFIEGNNIYFSDSYGNSPSKLMQQIRSIGKVNNSMALFQIMLDSGLTGYMNVVDYQSHSPQVSDCGRYATSVLIMREICHRNNEPFDLNRYHAMLSTYKNKNNLNTFDDAVTKFTEQFL